MTTSRSLDEAGGTEREGKRTIRLASSLLALLVILVGCSSGGTQAAARVGSRLLIGAEDAAEYAAIWQLPVDDVALASHLRTLARAQEDGLTLVRAQAGSAADNALAILNAADTGVVTIVGHNEGGVLRFADRSTLDIADLPQGGSRIAVISCSSQAAANDVGAVGLPVDVQLKLALRTESLFVDKVSQLSADQTTDVAVLQSSLLEAFDQARAEIPTAVAVALPIGGVAIVGIVIVGFDAGGG